MQWTYGGVYIPLDNESGFVGSKMGGRLTLEMPGPPPACKTCGKPMGYVLQLRFLPTSLDTSPYVAAVVWMCSDPAGEDGLLRCHVWDAYSGANAVVLLSELRGREGSYPSKYPPFRVDWKKVSDFSRYPDPDDFEEHEDDEALDLELEAFQNRFGFTKYGGFPYWLQADDTPHCPACGGPTVFVAQFHGELPRIGGRYIPFNAFGDAGSGFIFVCQRRCGPSGAAFLYQF